ncbi:hypothetical protein B9Z55_026750 [Caenorhabditis nigoni]|nr:hypothetical protein B9Z55_026750 [Caenorhabditis nigoni]
MRTSLLVLALLVPTVNSYRYTSDEVLKVLNSARSEIAEKAQIANMNELEYNPDLEEKIHMELIFNSGCSTRVIDRGSLKIYKNFKPEDMKDEQSIVEFLGAPGMTEMAYVKNLCLKNARRMHSFAFKKTNAPNINGPPGSKCPSGRRPTSDGLCALGKSYARKVVDSSRPWIVMKDSPLIAVRMKTEEEIELEKWIKEHYWNRINKPIGE